MLRDPTVKTIEAYKFALQWRQLLVYFKQELKLFGPKFTFEEIDLFEVSLKVQMLIHEIGKDEAECRR